MVDSLFLVNFRLLRGPRSLFLHLQSLVDFKIFQSQLSPGHQAHRLIQNHRLA